jgi:hypothetical protein
VSRGQRDGSLWPYSRFSRPELRSKCCSPFCGKNFATKSLGCLSSEKYLSSGGECLFSLNSFSCTEDVDNTYLRNLGKLLPDYVT